MKLYVTCNFSNAFSYLVLESCYSEGEEWRLAMKEYLRANYCLFVKELAETKLEIFELGAGYLVLVDFKNKKQH